MPRRPSQSLGSLFESALRRFADRTALISGTGKEITYHELDELSNRLANALSERNIGVGDVIALLLPNCFEFVIADLAIMKIGAAKVPMNSLLAPTNVTAMLAHSGATAMVLATSLAHLFESGSQAAQSLTLRIAVEDGEPAPPAFLRWDDVVKAAFPVPVRREAPPDSVGLIIYTGGTTGLSKGVVHRQEALVQNILMQVIGAEIGSNERMLLSTPLPHSAHLLCQAGLLKGATVWILDRFEPNTVLDLIDRCKITWLFAVPTMIYRLLDTMTPGSRDLTSLRTVLYGASPITRSQLTRALSIFGPIFLQIYGQTEAPNFITALTKEDHLNPALQLSCGQPVLAAQVRISDPDGQELPTGEVGEVQVRSVYTLQEYHNDPDSSKAAYVGEWLRTGDIGYQNGSGHLFLVDRLKDMIISGGMNVYSSEIENVIQAFNGVRQVAVIGVPHEEWGEAVTAFVVPVRKDLSVDALVAHCKEHLAKYKVPKSVQLVSEIPLTPYSKPDKKALRAQFWKGTDRGIS